MCLWLSQRVRILCAGMRRGQLRMRVGQLQQFRLGMLPIPLWPVQSGRRLHRPDRVPCRRVRPALDGRPDLHHDQRRGRRHRRTERRLLDHSSAVTTTPTTTTGGIHACRSSHLVCRTVSCHSRSTAELVAQVVADGSNWGNENVFSAAGIAQPALPNQLPGVSTSNNRLLVAVEDTTGRAWFFNQALGGPWGVSELP